MHKKVAIFLSFLMGVSLFALPSHAKEITVCIVDAQAEKNPVYFGLATTLTRLKCEIPGTERQIVTLGSLYNNGWHLVQVVGADAMRPSGNQRVGSPLYYLERETK